LQNPRKAFPAVTAAAVAILMAACGAASSDAGSAASGGGKDGAVVAKIGDVSISQAELDAELRKVNMKAVQDYYEAQRQALDGLINTRLLQAEATRQSKSVEELQQQIVSTAPAVADADVEKFYNDNKERMGQQSLDAMRERIRTYLSSQNQQQALASFIEDQRQKQGVSVMMDPPRAEVAIAQNDPYKGPAGAPVTIVEFSDFQ